MRVLVTGANGQLGSELRQLGAASIHSYIFTDIAELDITSRDAVERFVADNKVDYIINCAAYTAVDKAEDDAETAELINAKAVENLALAAKSAGAMLIHISTDYLFDGSQNTPYNEDSATSPQTVYGATKLRGEEAIKGVGCRHIIIRTAWLYSAFGNNFLKTMLRLTAERPEIKVVNDQIGTPTYAADLARVIFDIVESGKADGNEGVYHYTNEGVCSWFDFATEIARQTGHDKCVIKPCTTAEYPTKAHRPSYSVLDKSKIKRTFGIEIPEWKDGVKRCLDALKQDL